MAMTGKALELMELLAPTVHSLGLELLGIEFSPAVGNALVRLYIDGDVVSRFIADVASVLEEPALLLD